VTNPERELRAPVFFGKRSATGFRCSKTNGIARPILVARFSAISLAVVATFFLR